MVMKIQIEVCIHLKFSNMSVHNRMFLLHVPQHFARVTFIWNRE